MQDIIIVNVRKAPYTEINLNKMLDPETQHHHSYEFQNNAVTQPDATGEGKLSVVFYTLQPGKSNYPFHYHSGSEEVFYIISGTGTLETSKGNITVSEGDVIVMPPNENGAHMLTNTSTAPLTYLDVDTVASPEVVFYPHSGKIRVMSGKYQKNFKDNTEVNYLDGE